MSDPLATGVSSDAVQVSTTEPEIDFSKTAPIPDKFIKWVDFYLLTVKLSLTKLMFSLIHLRIPFMCCAFTCSSCDFPSCLGCKGNTQCLCLEEEGFCCKSVKHESTCCVCFADSCEIVTCPSACRCYRQICCFEYICGCPFQSGFKNTDVHFSNIPNRDGGEVTDDSKPCAYVLNLFFSLLLWVLTSFIRFFLELSAVSYLRATWRFPVVYHSTPNLLASASKTILFFVSRCAARQLNGRRLYCACYKERTVSSNPLLHAASPSLNAAVWTLVAPSHATKKSPAFACHFHFVPYVRTFRLN